MWKIDVNWCYLLRSFKQIRQFRTVWTLQIWLSNFDTGSTIHWASAWEDLWHHARDQDPRWTSWRFNTFKTKLMASSCPRKIKKEGWTVLSRESDIWESVLGIDLTRFTSWWSSLSERPADKTIAGGHGRARTGTVGTPNWNGWVCSQLVHPRVLKPCRDFT